MTNRLRFSSNYNSIVEGIVIPVQKKQCRSILLFIIVMASGCAKDGPRIGDNNTVYTPIYGDNRVYYLGGKSGDRVRELQTTLTNDNASQAKIQPNSPLSIILRSVEIPAATEISSAGNVLQSLVTEPADYAVVLDVGLKDDGSSSSIVVWYQRGVLPDQSMNFSNLLVYYEPSWDPLIAPYFRVRILNVTKEKNAEALKALNQAKDVAGSLGSFSRSLAVTPVIGAAFTAAELILANDNNKMLLDYSVQLYSSASAIQAGNEVAALKQGSYVVVGRPSNSSREYWNNRFSFVPESRVMQVLGRRVNVPTMSLTVGTFESRVPIQVIERSSALTKLLQQNDSASIEESQVLVARLSASIGVLGSSERIRRYKDSAEVVTIVNDIYDNKDGIVDKLAPADIYSLLRQISLCMGVSPQLATIEAAKSAIDKIPLVKCKES